MISQLDFSDLFTWKDHNPPYYGGYSTPEAHLAGPIVEPNWDPNEGGTPLLGHCLLVHLGRAFPEKVSLKRGTKAKSLSKIQENQQKTK